jgi:hypothetical protein
VEHPLWRAAWDFIFSVASLCCRCCSAPRSAISCVGLPREHDGWFSLELFHRLHGAGRRRHPRFGTSVLSGVLSRLLAIAGHGGAFLAWKTRRSSAGAQPPDRDAVVAAVAVLWPLATVLTGYVNAPMLQALAGAATAGCRSLVSSRGLIFVGVGLARSAMDRRFLLVRSS